MNRYTKRLQQRIETFHHSQGGAIILLVLAGFLILMLSSLMMFDAGRAASDKMEVQTAADTAAYSQAVIKARTMNMLTYANTAKRMIYAYVVTYWAAFKALLLSTVFHAVPLCYPRLDLDSCAKAVVGIAQIVSQGIKLGSQDWSTMSERSVDEVENLDNFQHYMVNITPWWAYAENMVRGIYNGATSTAAWPPPMSGLYGTVQKAYELIEAVTEFLNFLNIPVNFALERTTQTDKLPVDRADAISDSARTKYCTEFILSPEALVAMVDHYLSSEENPQGISKEPITLGFFGLQMLVPYISCHIASEMLGDAHLDYRLKVPGGNSENSWMQATSNITLAYMAGPHRKHSRTNFDQLLNDHAESTIMKSNGYWAMARSEITFGDTSDDDGGMLDKLGNLLSSFSQGLFAGSADTPSMWRPRWTAKLRPMALPGESLGTTSAGNPVGLKAIYVDTLPYFAIATAVSKLFNSDFDFGDSFRDFAFFYAAAAGYSGENIEGLTQ